MEQKFSNNSLDFEMLRENELGAFVLPFICPILGIT